MKFRKGDIVKLKVDSVLRYRVVKAQDQSKLTVQVATDANGNPPDRLIVFTDQPAALFCLVERKQSKKDRQIKELTEDLARIKAWEQQVTKAAVENRQRATTAQYLADKQLLDAGLVRIDFLREHALQGSFAMSGGGIDGHVVTQVEFVDHNRSSGLFKQFMTKLKEKK